MTLLSCASAISALILVSPEAPEAMCTLEGTLMVQGPDGVEVVPAFAEVYVNTHNLTAAPPVRHTMVQRPEAVGPQFFPRVLAVQVGDTVDFRNEDTQPHEVHAKRDVNLFDVKKENSKELTYSKLFLDSGISTIGCQIHRNMRATILTVPNSFHAHVDQKGMWKISGLPKRELEVVFWDSGGKQVKQRLTPCVSGPVNVSLKVVKPVRARGYGEMFQ